MMARHIVKYTHRDGVALDKPEIWCGSDSVGWYFVDAQHAALAKEQGSLIQPCKRCCAAIIKVLGDK